MDFCREFSALHFVCKNVSITFFQLKSDVTYRVPAVLEAGARSLYANVFLSKLDDYNELMLLLEAGDNPPKRFLFDSIAQFTKTG